MKQQTPGVTDAVSTDLLYASDVHVLDFSHQSLRAFLFGLILKTNFPCGPLVAGCCHLAAVTRGWGGAQTHGWMAKP